LEIKETIPSGNFMTMNEAAPDIRLPMERPLYIPSLKINIDSVIQTAQEEGIDSQALYDQVYVDKAELLDNIQKELQTQNQITLSAIVDRHPLCRGLAELVTYIAIASENRLTIFDDTHPEAIRWLDSTGIERKATIPRIILNRTNHD
jgi:hypothetical protein